MQVSSVTLENWLHNSRPCMLICKNGDNQYFIHEVVVRHSICIAWAYCKWSARVFYNNQEVTPHLCLDLESLYALASVYRWSLFLYTLWLCVLHLIPFFCANVTFTVRPKLTISFKIVVLLPPSTPLWFCPYTIPYLFFSTALTTFLRTSENVFVRRLPVL